MTMIFPDRQGSDSEKWAKYSGKTYLSPQQENDSVLPLWVADSDFQSPPCIIKALHDRVEHGVYGYGREPEQLTQLLVQRFAEKYQWHIDPEAIVYLPGLVCGLNLAVQALTDSGDKVLCPSPIYPPFRSAIKMAKREPVFQQVHLHHTRWLPDMPTLNSGAKLAMICNPLNPGGTVFSHQELLKFDARAKTENWIVCSDEIHCDLILDETVSHIPYASLNEDAAQRSITLMAPSKTFNIAGLGCSMAIIPNPKLRQRFTRAMAGLIPHVNVLGFSAAIAAYSDGEPWLQSQLDFLRQQHERVYNAINNLPGLRMTRLQATYLAWIDASELPVNNPHDFFEQHGVGLSPGLQFGDRRFVRLNFACSEETLTEALDRIQRAVKTLE
ncbi:MalY/PatB family protein [Thaumasiovibrio subtropicus]|uniref:MalY/PatB family protein n=1 Tax=Thaumasiovibrio subtropicus TaxID=1891207 RepID=UPI000B34FF35|nr:PatB family C-S lyase [Thaumasiovibrio subtropicus]